MSASSPVSGPPPTESISFPSSISAAAAPDPQVGCRVQILKDRATVRYLGPVRGQEGSWVGVEWDDPSRGKHDGTTGGVRYFTCESTSHPTPGSFVREEKVSFGCGVLEALVARYTNARGEMGEDVQRSEMWVHTVRNRKVQIELVGEELIRTQQSQIKHLPSARVVGAAVSHLGDPSQLAAALPSLTELDLTCNLVHSWDLVQGLSTALPHLKILNLSDNRLVLPMQVEVAGRAQLPGLRALVLNDCFVKWAQVLAVEPLLPELQELHLCGNSISRLGRGEAAEGEAPEAVQGFAALEVLSLEDNQLSEWSEILTLAHLPRLTKLHLSNNPLREVTYPSPTSPAASSSSAPEAEAPGAAAAAASAGAGAAFTALSALLLGGCQLGSWGQVDQIGRFPALKDLRVTGNPVLSLSKSGGRFEIIGRVPLLQSLNGAAVLPRERRDAEMRYLQNILAEMEEAPDADSRALVPQSHPRYPELMAKYGSVLGTVGRSQQGSSLASNMLEVHLTCVGVSKSAKMGTQVKKLPRSITIGALKHLCEKLFKVKGSHMTLFMKQPGDPMPEDIGAEDEQTLGALGLQDGFEILVDEFDPEERRLQAERARGAELQAQAEREGGQARVAEKLATEAAKALAF